MRQLRIEAGLTQKDVADALGWELPKLLRIENSQVGWAVADVNALLDRYNVNDDDRVSSLLQLARVSLDESLSDRYRNALSRSFVEYLEHEEAAVVIRQFETSYVPGLLQTADYARVIIENSLPDVPQEIIELRIRARLDRKQLLVSNDPAEAYFVIDESALWREIGIERGHRELMNEQLLYLREMNGHPNVHIQVIPFAAGAYSAMKGPFAIVELADTASGNLVYLEYPDDEVLIYEESQGISQYIDAFGRLQTIAIMEVAFDAFVERLIETMRSVRSRYDDP